jgi:hypothetical protein
MTSTPLMAAKANGRLDSAFVIGVMIDHAGNAFYDDAISTENLAVHLKSFVLTSRVCDGNGYELEPWVISGRRRKAFELPTTPCVPF